MDVSEITQEQLDALQTKVDELEQFKGESAPKLEQFSKAQEELEGLKKEKERLESEVNPNWKEARAKMTRLEEVLKGKGIEVDEQGNPKQSTVNMEEVEKRASASARKELINDRLEELLSVYDKDSKEVVRHFYNKLSADEEVSMTNIRDFVKQADGAAREKSEVKRIQIDGQGPRLQDESKVDEARVENLGQKMNLGFTRESNKK